MTPDKNQKRSYSIEPYNPDWVTQFETIKKALEEVFKNKALAIEHVGSTSVAGMKAKPLIDVLMTVDYLEPFISEKEVMTNKGYEWAENYVIPDSLIFYKTVGGDKKIENIHVLPKDSFKAKQFIVTRDYLRAHPKKAREYENLKEKLNKEFPGDYPAYRTGKNAFLQELEKLSFDWKK
jgi:GrpB-like predicted nucleotidyltransferase (UPF0157 family)